MSTRPCGSFPRFSSHNRTTVALVIFFTRFHTLYYVSSTVTKDTSPASVLSHNQILSRLFLVNAVYQCLLKTWIWGGAGNLPRGLNQCPVIGIVTFPWTLQPIMLLIFNLLLCTRLNVEVWAIIQRSGT